VCGWDLGLWGRIQGGGGRFGGAGDGEDGREGFVGQVREVGCCT